MMRSRRHRRWLFIAVCTLAAFIAVALIGVEVVLHSDLPRRILVDKLGEQTGLSVEASEVSISWSGVTRVTELRVGPGSGEEPAIVIPSLMVEHTSLLRLALLTPFSVQSIHLDHPEVHVDRDGQGRWNLERMVESYERHHESGAEEGEEAGPIPDVVIDGGRVSIRGAAQGSPELVLTIDGSMSSSTDPATSRKRLIADLHLTSAEAELDTDLRLAAQVDREVVNFTSLEGRVLGASLSGQAVVHLHELDASHINIAIGDLQAASLARLVPGLTHLTGQFDISVADEDNPRFHRPDSFAFKVDIRPRHASFGKVLLLQTSAHFLIDRSEAPATRYLLTGSVFQLGDGSVSLWGRVTAQPTGWFAYASADLKRLNIQPFVQTFSSSADPPTGLISGQVTLHMPVDDPARAQATATVSLMDCDFANTGLFAGLYNLLHVNLSGHQPTGQGTATVRLEGKRLVVQSLRYQNRGSTLHLAGRVEDITQQVQSPVVGVAFGSMRALPDLPILDLLQNVLSALQSDVIAVNISGSVGSPDFQPMSLIHAKQTIKQILGIQSESSQGQP